jgi:hypothetical protein
MPARFGVVSHRKKFLMQTGCGLDMDQAEVLFKTQTEKMTGFPCDT